MKLRTGFMGSPEFAVPSLVAVHRTTELQLVVTQPDRPAGRGRRLTPPPVKREAERLGLAVEQPTRMRDGTLAAKLRELELDLIVVVAFGRILPQDILDVPRHGCVNVHASILPRWRGAAPIQRAVLAGDAETGVSIMQMEAGLDTGPVYHVARTPIGAVETSGELFARLAQLGAEALADFLQAFPEVPPPAPQDDALATHAPPLTKDEGRVTWERTVADVVNHVRGMDPWPGAFSPRGDDRIKLFGVRPSGLALPSGATAGQVVGLDGDALAVAVLDGVVAIAEVQPPGKRRMPAGAYVRGQPFAAGERLDDT